ncbi:MAG: anti-sigma factor family protein [Candidatus Methylomirabilis sp.]
MRCEDAGTRLVELIDEALPSERRAEIFDHLTACTACATEFSAYQDVVALVQADPVPEPSPRFWEEFLPSLRRRIEREASGPQQRPAVWLAGLRSRLVLPRPLVAGVAVAAISILIVVRLPGSLWTRADRQKAPAPVEQSTGREGETRDWNRAPQTEAGKRDMGEAVIVAGEVVEDASTLAAAIQRLPWVDEIADRIEAAWVWRPESDPRDWLSSLSEEDQQLLLDRLRSFRWSLS